MRLEFRKALACVSLLLLASLGLPAQRLAGPLTEDDLFRVDKIWDVDVTLSRADWAAVQPRQHLTATGAPQPAPGPVNDLAAELGYVFEYGHAAIAIGGRRFDDVGFRFKGNNTFLEARGGLKLSFKIDFNRYVRGQRLGRVSTINFHNNVTDPGAMNEALGYQLYRDAGVPAPRTAFARVVLTVPGLHDRRYVGLYGVVEEVDANFARARFGAPPGALFKPVTPRVFPDLGNRWERYQDTFDPQTDVSVDEQRRVIELCQLVDRGSDADFSSRIDQYVDLGAFAKFLAVAAWLADPDSLLDGGKNFYMYLRPDTRLVMFIPWDLDHAFGQNPVVEPWQMQTLSITMPSPRGDNRLVERLLRLESFRRPYLGALSEWSRSLFRADRISAQVDALSAVIRPAVAAESVAAAARFDRVVRGEAVTLESGKTATSIKRFVVTRAASVAGQLARQ